MNAASTARGEPPAHLAWHGPVTVYEAPQLRQQLLSALQGGRDLELDLAAVEEIDTAGIQLLLLAQREALDAGRRCTVLAASAAVREAVQLLRLARPELPAVPAQETA